MDKKTINIILLGPPGAGKGTQAKLLIDSYNLLHISTGDLLRKTVKEGSDLGKTLKEYMEKGQLVPDEIVTKCVINHIDVMDISKGIIFDGYPRTKKQAESLEIALKEINVNIDMVIYLKTSETTIIERLSGRRVCTECNKNYHIKNIPPKKEGICDTCNVELIQRKDDNLETIKNRIKIYMEQTQELIDYYKNKDLLVEVNSDLSAQELFKDIEEIFKRKNLI